MKWFTQRSQSTTFVLIIAAIAASCLHGEEPTTAPAPLTSPAPAVAKVPTSKSAVSKPKPPRKKSSPKRAAARKQAPRPNKASVPKTDAAKKASPQTPQPTASVTSPATGPAAVPPTTPAKKATSSPKRKIARQAAPPQAKMQASVPQKKASVPLRAQPKPAPTLLQENTTTPHDPQAAKSAGPARQTDDQEEDEDESAADESEDDDELTEAPVVEPQIMIRVLLQEFDAEPKTTLSIHSEQGFYLSTPVSSRRSVRHEHEIIHLVAMHHNLFMQAKDGKYKRLRHNEISIRPINGMLKLDNLSYEGTINIRFDDALKKMQIINKISLDDYIYSVLRFESLSYWPAEVHRVQAIASRSYAVHRIQQARRQNAKAHYDIKNNNFHQVYNGNHSCHHLRKAVEDTHNQILTYKGTVAQTMFDICCGGIIGAAMKKKDADKPYLFRKTRCSFCKDKAPYSWTTAFNKSTLLSRLLAHPRTAKKAGKLGSITGIGIKEKDLAGIVHRIFIHGSKENIILTANEFKAALQERLKSNAYTVKKQNNDVIIHGYGFGHNIGLCQIGVRELVARGWEFEEILAFYFPKTKIMRLKVL